MVNILILLLEICHNLMIQSITVTKSEQFITFKSILLFFIKPRGFLATLPLFQPYLHKKTPLSALFLYQHE